MNEELSRLEEVELNDVWENEPQDFTPWLAEVENLKLLGETLGMKLEVEGVEISGEGFRADILCKNEDDSRVLIENQLQETDHKHLGQILTYVAGLNAQTVIWIAKKFCNEHRAALDKLNEMTADKGFRFFGIEIKVWQIGDSDRAPQFDVVSSPNDWSRSTTQDAQSAISKDLTETQRQQEKYWTELGNYMIQFGSQLNYPKPSASHIIRFYIGRSGFGVRAWQLAQEKTIGISIVIKGEDAKAFFHLLKEQSEEIEEELGEKLEWSEKLGRNERRLDLIKQDTDPTDDSDRNNQYKWFADKLNLFDKVFRHRIQELNVEDYEPDEEDEE